MLYAFEREKRPRKTTRRASASRRHSATVGRSTTTARAMGDGAMDDAVRGARARSVVRCVRDATTTTRNDATRRLTRRNDATMAARASAARARRWD